jgi:hypothetical protein
VFSLATYCSLYDLKKRLQIEIGDVSSDPELEDVLLEAAAILEGDLRKFVELPLDNVPDLLKYACADFAASIFKGRRAKPEAHGEDLSVGFRKAYDLKLSKYVRGLGSLATVGRSQMEDQVFARDPSDGRNLASGSS